MKLTKDIHGRLQLFNVIGFLAVPICGYVDRIIFGFGIAFTISGLLFVAAFLYKTESLFFDWTKEKIFDWLFKEYSHRAANLFYAGFFLLLGLASIIQELR
jgi:hypothetical protein